MGCQSAALDWLRKSGSGRVSKGEHLRRSRTLTLIVIRRYPSDEELSARIAGSRLLALGCEHGPLADWWVYMQERMLDLLVAVR
jgi:hypothetical protein